MQWTDDTSYFARAVSYTRNIFMKSATAKHTPPHTYIEKLAREDTLAYFTSLCQREQISQTVY
jgi:hypothetical protein